MSPKFARFILKVFGWKTVGSKAPVEKCILLGAPHTSIWDFVVAYLYYRAMDGHARCMVKEEMFFWPLGPIVKSMGGFPINRKNPGAMVRSVIREMDKGGEFHLAVALEGTRKPVKRWKSGFHLIAKEANIPVYICIFDWGKKEVGIVREFKISDDAKADTARVQEIYESLHLVGKHPKNYITH